jgi:hypothetical protein
MGRPTHDDVVDPIWLSKRRCECGHARSDHVGTSLGIVCAVLLSPRERCDCRDFVAASRAKERDNVKASCR